MREAIRHNDTMVVGKIWVTGKQDMGLEAQEGGPPGGSTDQVVPGIATLEWIFLRTCLQWARALLWGKVQQMGALPCHELWSLLVLRTQFPHSNREWRHNSRVRVLPPTRRYRLIIWLYYLMRAIRAY